MPRAYLCRQCRRHIASDSRAFTEGDIVLLRPTRDPDADGILTKPLSPSQTIHTHRGTLSHASVLGKRVRQIIATSKGINYRLHEPTLAEYVRLTPRLVTPIYPADANLIVSLLDIHVTPPPSDGSHEEQDEPPLEILEAGTGHGALTLHLARAIQAANTPPPPLPPLPKTRQQQQQAKEPTQPSPASASSPDSRSPTTPPSSANASTSSDEAAADSAHHAYEAWKRTRRAVLHTLDISRQHSAHARKVVRGFRRGLYLPHVDFHVGDVSDFVGGMMRARAAGTAAETDAETGADAHSAATAAADADADTGTGTGTPAPASPPAPPEGAAHEEAQPAPFLTHVFLDLPSAHTHLRTVSRALRVDGVVMAFKPSITQIAECVREIKDQGLPLQLERVVELGTGMSGGRLWDVRSVVPRALGRTKGKGRKARDDGGSGESAVETGEGSLSEDGGREEREEGIKARDEEQVEQMGKTGDQWMMVCRPKVGEVIVGGGFLGVWRRTRDKAADRS